MRKISTIRRLYEHVKSNPWDHKMVAVAFRSRGFRWNFVEVEKVESNSNSISFGREWNKLISRIAAITGPTTIQKSAATSKQSWKHFEHVLCPDQGHETEKLFSDALFEALRTSLSDFTVPNSSEAKWIVLKNSKIAFGKGINRATLGFSEEYALSEDSRSGHGCFVIGTRESSNVTEEEAFWYNDLTAVVELKLDRTSCKNFEFGEDNCIKEPVLASTHGPMGKAMFYALDVWHCLARQTSCHQHSCGIVGWER
jgi:hypothetical protein